MLYTFGYDASFIPAMPVVEIVIGHALAVPTLTLTALVDSGADATIIPVRLLNQVRARKRQKAWLRGTTAGRIRVDLYEISLRLGDHNQALLRVVGETRHSEAILGRDVLNQLIVTLNGLANVVEVSG